ncbi:MAG: diaminopimelate decarboxylase, partial [Proteobacteria bacterium]|nr:diaminopimelate decarboxylase [Pseudomonadota bacterium]
HKFLDLLSAPIALGVLHLGHQEGRITDNNPPRDYAEAIKEELQGFKATLILEPGRVIVGNAAILVTEVQYTKSNRGTEQVKKFVVVDAAMNDLTRPSLYGAYHAIVPVLEKGAACEVVDIVGPICETGDFLAKDRDLPRVEQGDLLAVMSAGAYGFSMSSNYNSRPRVAEVLVDGSHYEIIRRRETFESLVEGETIPGGVRHGH